MSSPQPKPGILAISPYVGGKSSAKGTARIVKLSSNETPLGPSPAAIKAFTDSAATLHRYPDGTAIKLREAIAEAKLLPVEHIICGAGSDELIGLLVHAYAGPGDEVLYSQHGFLMYKIYTQAAGANPNNPTGSYTTEAELIRLRAELPPHVILAIDGAYAEYSTQPDYSCGRNLVATTDNTVSLRTFSKIYGLSALRLGWAYAPPAIADVLNRIRSPFNVSTPAINAGIAAIGDKAFTEKAKQFNAQWLQWLAAQLAALGLVVHPSIANFLLVEFPSAQSAASANAFLMERGLIVRDVIGYGLPQCLRISIGLEEDNRAVVDALADFLKS
jgi:histidinol-phosphate aminotransferase